MRVVEQYIFRFIIGGIVVSFFAVLGDVFKPKTFAGLFGAAPSIALATLALTVHKKGPMYASIEGRSMMLGAAGLLVYSFLVSWLLMRARLPVLATAASGLAVWFVCAFGLWFLLLK